MHLIPLAVSAAVMAAQPAPRCNAGAADRVLFIGNSYTYVNNVPRLLEEVAAALPGPCISTEMIAQGGASLRAHWQSDSAVRRIREGRWTDVVIQDQSTFGEEWWVNGRFRVPDSAPELDEFGERFIQEIRNAHARPIVFSHWSDSGAPERDQQALDFAFAGLSNTSTEVSPVGRAIKDVARDATLGSPYYSDGHHLSPVGGYTEALVLYRTITGRSVVGAPSRIQGPAVDFQGGTVFPDSTVTLVDLSDGVATRIQGLVAARFTDWQKAVVRASRPGSLEKEFPSVSSSGTPVILSEIAGRWQGRTNVLPSPGNQPLLVEAVLGGTSDSLYLRLPGMEYAGPIAVTVDGAMLMMKGSVLPRGRARRGGAPQAFEVTVRAARAGDGFEGVARAHQAGNATIPSLDAIGEFRMRR